ncbi:hypothetical protein [Acuticoccus mangrovi]|uniref:TNase-like domain-containing protein n=1 Tax=Acuticoccus mangrovi TaxID=2796142 RepID=A0A934MDH2_9HYPH|nr:hypothetical protein [Acuticoccus mangrovi]MBJ3776352.1 hypothetical protein [Acuticoccus mangrovi]
MARVTLAATLLVAAVMLVAAAWLFTGQGEPGASPGTGPARVTATPRAASTAAPAPSAASPASAAASPADAPPPEEETDSDIRYVEENGIASPRPTGPLVRDTRPIEPPEPEAPRPPQPERYRLVVVESAGLIDARTHFIKLAHIEAPAADASCSHADGAKWPCGRRARTALRRLVRRRAIDCLDLAAVAAQQAGKPLPAPTREETRAETCTVAGTDLAEWLVEQGWATPTADAPEGWQAMHRTAVEEERGLYAADAR